MQNTSNTWWKRYIHEPLFVFSALAVLIFIGDHVISLNQADPKAIVITPEIRQEVRQIFSNALKRDPTTEELKVLMDRWVDNEVLYREGLALGLDKGDSSIRERVIFKALSVTQAEISLPKLDDNGLKKWFDENAQQYETPALVHFQEAVPAGKPSHEALKRFIDALNGKGKSDLDSTLEIFKDRPRFTIVEGYGEEFTHSLEQLSPGGEWHLIDSKAGLRVVRLVSVKPGEKAHFESIKAKVYSDWKNQTAAELSTKAIRDMGKKYKVIEQGDKP